LQAPETNRQKTLAYTILVGEDDKLDVHFLRRAYTKSGLPHTLMFVHDGKQVMDYLEGKPPYDNRDEFPKPDLLLLDLKMARVDGFNVLRWMQVSGMSRVPVVVLSGSDLEADRRFSKQLGAREYRVKSSSLDDTVNLLKEVCLRWIKPRS
jgi:two-component system response regulator